MDCQPGPRFEQRSSGHPCDLISGHSVFHNNRIVVRVRYPSVTFFFVTFSFGRYLPEVKLISFPCFWEKIRREIRISVTNALLRAVLLLLKAEMVE